MRPAGARAADDGPRTSSGSRDADDRLAGAGEARGERLAEAGEARQPCLRCGVPLPVRLMGCKGGHCPNCRHPYPHGDCSD